jgi:hypothetical protein
MQALQHSTGFRMVLLPSIRKSENVPEDRRNGKKCAVLDARMRELSIVG